MVAFTRSAPLALVCLLALPSPSAAQDVDPMAEQRCVWSCLANSPGAASVEYSACVRQYCEALGSVMPEPAAPLPPSAAVAVSPRPAPRPLREGTALGPRTAPPTMPAAAPAPAMPSTDAGATLAGWSFGPSADGTGMFAGTSDAGRGTRIDWLCAKGRDSVLALSPYDGDGGFVVTAGARTEPHAARIENGVAYVPAGLTSPIFLHIASGQAFEVADGTGRVLGRFDMTGAALAIGQAEGRCR